MFFFGCRARWLWVCCWLQDDVLCGMMKSVLSWVGWGGVAGIITIFVVCKQRLCSLWHDEINVIMGGVGGDLGWGSDNHVCCWLPTKKRVADFAKHVCDRKKSVICLRYASLWFFLFLFVFLWSLLSRGFGWGVGGEYFANMSVIEHKRVTCFAHAVWKELKKYVPTSINNKPQVLNVYVRQFQWWFCHCHEKDLMTYTAEMLAHTLKRRFGTVVGSET